MNRQQTYLVRELQTGIVYRDVLSGYLVLVRSIDLQRTEPIASGLMWNPLYGAHQPFTIHDNMLCSAEGKTYKPDTRY